ncbi:MAG: DMT family transporter [Flavobacteriales bacterium]
MHPTWRTAALTAFALLMFAANSLLCRMALGTATVDAASYSTIRIVSGAVALVVIGALRHGGKTIGGDRSSDFLLFLYAVPFSFAYVGLTTGTGALILFGCVQLTMLLAGWRSGERLGLVQWIGVLIAVGGLVYLLLPGLHAPKPLPALLMGVAGVAWGLYSLRGRQAGDPFMRTKGNFLRAVPLVVAVSLIAWPWHALEWKGVLLAVLSGAGASAVGYVAWYAALKHLGAIRASVLQLLVPVLAALAGVAVLSEAFSLRLGLAAAFVLGGVSLTLRYSQQSTKER